VRFSGDRPHRPEQVDVVLPAQNQFVQAGKMDGYSRKVFGWGHHDAYVAPNSVTDALVMAINRRPDSDPFQPRQSVHQSGLCQDHVLC